MEPLSVTDSGLSDAVGATLRGLKACGYVRAGTAYTATWPSGEYLVRIYGRASSTGYVGQIRFVTNTGRVLGPYGAATSQFNLTNFDYTVPAGTRILGFAGRANSYVTAIGVVYGP